MSSDGKYCIGRAHCRDLIKLTHLKQIVLKLGALFGEPIEFQKNLKLYSSYKKFNMIFTITDSIIIASEDARRVFKIDMGPGKHMCHLRHQIDKKKLLETHYFEDRLITFHAGQHHSKNKNEPIVVNCYDFQKGVKTEILKDLEIISVSNVTKKGNCFAMMSRKGLVIADFE